MSTSSRAMPFHQSFLSAVGLLPIAIVLIGILLAIIEPRFLGAQNLINVLRGSALLMIVTTGQMLVLISRGFDLSVGSIMALTSVVSASVMVSLGDSVSPGLVSFIGLGAGLCTGLVIGLFNGFCVAVLRITPFMVTLATASITVGIALLITNGVPIYGLPKVFVDSGRGSWLGFPVAVYAALLVVLIVSWVQRATRLGVHLYAIGGDPHAAMVSGLPVIRGQIGVYMASGLLASVAAMLLTAQIGSGQGSLGADVALQSIGAAVIAGVSLQGGVGVAWRVAMGALFILLLNNTMDLLRIESKAQTIVMGLFIVLVVAMDARRKKGQP